MRKSLLALFFVSVCLLSAEKPLLLYQEYVRTGPRWGFIDNDSNVVIKPAFMLASAFHEDMAWVLMSRDYTGDMYGYINRQGEVLFQKGWEDVGDFSEGLARVKQDGKWGFIGTDGEYVIEPKYAYVSNFNEGRAIFRNSERRKGLLDFGFIDKSGNEIIPDRYPFAADFHQGRAIFMRDSLFGFVNDKGIELIPNIYTAAGNFAEGVAPVRDTLGLWGFIDTTGQTVIDFTLQDARPFSEGIACCMEDSLWGFLGHDGKFLFKPIYKDVDRFSEGLCAVIMDSLVWGYVDKKGKKMVTPAYDIALPFHDGIGLVFEEDDRANLNGKYINSTGYRIDFMGFIPERERYRIAVLPGTILPSSKGD